MNLIRHHIRIIMMAYLSVAVTKANVSLIKLERIYGWGRSVFNGRHFEYWNSPTWCAYKCLKRPYCAAVSYSHSDGLCVYLGMTFVTLSQMGDTEVILLKDIPVSLIRKPGMSTVAEAQQMCSEVGQHLISYEQLNSVIQTMPYSNCGCGYVAEGNLYVPYGYQTTSCDYNIGMHACTVPDAAYCTTM